MKLMSAPAVIHGCGVKVEGSEIAKSFTIALRQAGVKNQRAGRNAAIAKTMRPAKTQFAAAPRENCGGRSKRNNPSNATTIPSAHFCVPPARKQARTGRSATALLPKNPVGEILRDRRRRRDCGGDSGIG